MFSIGNGGIGEALNDDDDADGAAGRPVPALAGTACSAAIDATTDDPAGPPGAARAAAAIATGNDGKGKGTGKPLIEPLSHAMR